jgi:hypothetical protein
MKVLSRRFVGSWAIREMTNFLTDYVASEKFGNNRKSTPLNSASPRRHAMSGAKKIRAWPVLPEL